MKYKHIIWDYNGTLLNDAYVCVEVINGMLNDRNLPSVNLETYRAEFDFPVKDYYERVGFKFDNEPFDVVGEEFIVHYNKLCRNAPLHPHAVEIISKFHANGIRQSVLSARKESSLIVELEQFGLTKYLDNISGLTDNLAHSKLENGIQMRKQINLPDSQILMIGDTLHDADTARAMGIDFMAVSHGHHPPEKLRTATIHVFSHLEALYQNLMSK